MKFSSMLIQHLREKSDSVHLELIPTALNTNQRYLAKVFALQGRIFQQQQFNGLSTDCYINAVNTSLIDVPWVRDIDFISITCPYQ